MSEKKEYTLIPEGYEKQYEKYLAKMKGEEYYKEYLKRIQEEEEKEEKEFERKDAVLKKMFESIKNTKNEEKNPNEKRARFLEDVGNYDIDHEKAIKKADETQNKNKLQETYRLVYSYCEENKIKFTDGCKIERDGNKLILRYKDENGIYREEEFLINDLLNDEQK